MLAGRAGEDKVIDQFPYRNIARIEVVRNHEGRDFARDFIGIILVNPNDADTLCPAAETIMKLHGWHYRITKGARAMPLEQLHDLIRKRLPPDFPDRQ